MWRLLLAPPGARIEVVMMGKELVLREILRNSTPLALSMRDPGAQSTEPTSDYYTVFSEMQSASCLWVSYSVKLLIQPSRDGQRKTKSLS